MDEVVGEIEKADIGSKIATAIPKESLKSALNVLGDEIDKAEIEAKISEAISNEFFKNNSSVNEKCKDTLQEVATIAPDAFSVASSMVSSMTDILKKLEESAEDHALHSSAVDMSMPSIVTGATILHSVDNTDVKTDGEETNVEDASDTEDSWSVVEDERKQVENDENIARAASMIGSALFSSDMDSGESNADQEKNKEADESDSSIEPLSPVVLARWETELKQLHEIGFLDDIRNVDALEHLEASHVGVDSTEKVTVNAAVEYLLGM